MKSSRSRGIACALVALSLMGGFGCGASDDDTAEMQAALDDLAGNEIEDMSLLGVGITVAMPDGRVFRSAAGYSEPTGSVPYDLGETRQVVGSVTKVYTAVMIMQLVEEGVLSLDDTIDRWFSFPRANEITVRMLLNHTSGLPEFHDLFTQEDYGRTWAPEEIVRIAADAGLWSSPGDSPARYSNSNYVALGLIVEAATGKTWEANLRERITAPLGLGHTMDAGDDGASEGLAGGWIRGDQGWLDSTTVLDPSIGWANGSMTTTNDELVTFARAFFAGELFSSPDTLASMLQFDVPMSEDSNPGQPPTRIGLCIHRVDAEGFSLIGHLGHAPGYGAAMLLDPDSGAIIVVTSNTGGVLPGLTASKIALYLKVH